MLVNNYLNYIGSKDRYLPQILKFIEAGANKTGGSLLVDLFCGSAVVGANSANYFNKVYCIDACKEVITLHEWMKSGKSSDTLLNEIDNIIKEYELSKTNKEGYLRLREAYNANIREDFIEPSELYCLITHSYNYSLHTNKKGEFNVPFGANRSSFNKSLKKKFTNWKEHLDNNHNVFFFWNGFDNFDLPTTKSVFFVDPPYSASISKHPYRVGNIKWGDDEDKKLLKLLDEFHSNGHLFVFTNVVSNNGVLNRTLFNWIEVNKGKYFEHPVSVEYKNCSYQRKNNGRTNEVIITNFTINGEKMKYLTFTRVVDVGALQPKHLPIDVMASALAYITPTNDGKGTILGITDGTKHLLVEDYEEVRAMISVFHA